MMTIICKFFSNLWKSIIFILFGKTINVLMEGGDFTSISEACESISDSSYFKPYKVCVGPGVFSEPKIIIKKFVSLKGIG